MKSFCPTEKSPKVSRIAHFELINLLKSLSSESVQNRLLIDPEIQDLNQFDLCRNLKIDMHQLMCLNFLNSTEIRPVEEVRIFAL